MALSFADDGAGGFGGGNSSPVPTNSGAGSGVATAQGTNVTNAGEPAPHAINPPATSASSSTTATTSSVSPTSYPRIEFMEPAGYAGGGAIPDDADEGDSGSGDSGDAGAIPTTQDPMTGMLAQALDSVDTALAYGRKLFGLGGSSGAIDMGNQPVSNMGIRGDAGGGQQVAGNIPSVPAGQSETGIPPAQPRLGPLPPTSNPFGKRQLSQNDTGIPDDDGDEA